MGSKLHKHIGLDKYDAHLPKRAEFLQDDYQVSEYQELFHLPVAYGSKSRRATGFYFGVQKRVYHVSGRGIQVDGHYKIGKSDQ